MRKTIEEGMIGMCAHTKVFGEGAPQKGLEGKIGACVLCICKSFEFEILWSSCSYHIELNAPTSSPKNMKDERKVSN
jgi:hypothetical protein